MTQRILSLSLLVFLAGCTAEGLLDADLPTVVYHPPGRMLPFPSDRYLAANTEPRPPTAEQASGYHLDLAPYRNTDPLFVHFAGLDEGLAGLDGFGTSAEIAIELTASPRLGALADDDLNYAASVQPDSPIHLISIDPADPQAGTPIAFLARAEADGKTLFLSPWVPLRQSSWYAVVLHPSLRDVMGRSFAPAPAFLADYAAGRGEGLEGEGYTRLKEVLSSTPLFAVTFRTASIAPFLDELLDEIRADAPAPFTYSVQAAGGSQPHLARIVEGQFLKRDFRDADGRLNRDLDKQEWTAFTLTIPVTSATHAEPFGLVLGQHGLGDRRQAVMRIAGGLAKAGLASIAIDAPHHGSRTPDGSREIADSLDHRLGLWTDGERFQIRGWVFRDIIRQQVIDHLQVLRLARQLELDFGGAPGADIDASAPAYSGQSMGGLMGGVSGGALPELARVALNVPGGRITSLVARNELVGPQGVVLIKPAHISESDLWRMIAMMQSAMDPGDPINWVQRIQRDPPEGQAPRPLLIQGSRWDGTIPNFMTIDLARTAGTPLFGPWAGTPPGLPRATIPPGGLGGAAPGAFFLFETIDTAWGIERAEHGNLWPSYTALDQAAAFLATGVIEAPAEVGPLPSAPLNPH